MRFLKPVPRLAQTEPGPIVHRTAHWSGPDRIPFKKCNGRDGDGKIQGEDCSRRNSLYISVRLTGKTMSQNVGFGFALHRSDGKDIFGCGAVLRARRSFRTCTACRSAVRHENDSGECASVYRPGTMTRHLVTGSAFTASGLPHVNNCHLRKRYSCMQLLFEIKNGLRRFNVSHH
jgi:hypothetical protein